ncbi:MAG: alpha/beta hydrolase [Bacillota bacterium]|nr:alpha/beta hydrolase [Bacillota bacterium]
MPVEKINDIDIYWKITGDKGETLILVHGSWGDHHNWDSVVNELAKSFRVLTFDRRGYSLSKAPDMKSSFKNDAWDLIKLIEYLHISSAHIAGNLFGASIILWTATQRPDLFKTMIVNDPPLFGLLKEDQQAQVEWLAFDNRMEAVLNYFKNNNIEAAAKQYVETIGIGTGGWEKLSDKMHQIFIDNAMIWYKQITDPASIDFDLSLITNFKKPTLLSNGALSPAIFHKVNDKLANSISHSKRLIYQGAAHVPHITHPQKFIEVIKNFCIG